MHVLNPIGTDFFDEEKKISNGVLQIHMFTNTTCI